MKPYLWHLPIKPETRDKLAQLDAADLFSLAAIIKAARESMAQLLSPGELEHLELIIAGTLTEKEKELLDVPVPEFPLGARIEPLHPPKKSG